MADFITGVGMVASALVQEGVSRAVSFVLGKSEEQTSQEHNAERLNMSLSALELALERSGKLPITDASLIRRWHVFKHANVEGRDLLTRHMARRQAQEEAELQGTKRRRWTIPIPAPVSAKNDAGWISTDDVRRFAWLADCADKFVRDVESGCTLRHHTFCSPLVRHLLQGKTFTSEVEEGRRRRRFYMRSVCFEGRGVETLLGYHYDDREVAERGFGLNLVLRLSESTDVVGTTIKCLQSMVSQFEQVNRTAAMGELTLLANLQDTPQDYSPASHGGRRRVPNNSRKYNTRGFRPDPVCCKGDGHGPCASNVVSPSLSNMFPEQVIYFGYHYCVPAPGYSSSAVDQSARRLMRPARRQPLGMRVAFLHYFVINKQQDGYESYDTTGRENSQVLRYDNLQQVAADETGSSSSETVNCLLLQPELTKHHISWFSKHGLACFHRTEGRTDRAPKTSRGSRTARKRKEKTAR